mmetsp:Transcript_45449/g.106208  ORF Transcript_45449/g.106208 Transcript_45449/m.106208 type:complete len:218 (-) Transcript_45449:98-751(-)
MHHLLRQQAIRAWLDPRDSRTKHECLINEICAKVFIKQAEVFADTPLLNLASAEDNDEWRLACVVLGHSESSARLLLNRGVCWDAFVWAQVSDEDSAWATLRQIVAAAIGMAEDLPGSARTKAWPIEALPFTLGALGQKVLDRPLHRGGLCRDEDPAWSGRFAEARVLLGLPTLRRRCIRTVASSCSPRLWPRCGAPLLARAWHLSTNPMPPAATRS